MHPVYKQRLPDFIKYQSQNETVKYPQSLSWLTGLQTFQNLFLLQRDSKISKKNKKYSHDYSPIAKKAFFYRKGNTYTISLAENRV